MRDDLIRLDCSVGLWILMERAVRMVYYKSLSSPIYLLQSINFFLLLSTFHSWIWQLHDMQSFTLLGFDNYLTYNLSISLDLITTPHTSSQPETTRWQVMLAVSPCLLIEVINMSSICGFRLLTFWKAVLAWAVRMRRLVNCLILK